MTEETFDSKLDQIRGLPIIEIKDWDKLKELHDQEIDKIMNNTAESISNAFIVCREEISKLQNYCKKLYFR